MKLLRYILFPVMPVYYLVTWLRNKLYDAGIKSSKSYDFPVICVGNLSAGGTGKTPMIEYLISLLKEDKRLATLSRGYGRDTKGFVLGNTNSTANSLGDEPYQFYNKYTNSINVAVDENRQNGIAKLQELKPIPEVVLLDDAYQHRKVKAGLNILLTTYSNLYTKDWVLPTGNLRELRAGAKRAKIIVVTKCPNNLSESEKLQIIKDIQPKDYQQVFFSRISYNDVVISSDETKPINSLSKFTLVTGIANAESLLDYLNTENLNFKHLEYKDHYNFTQKDVEQLAKESLIITTEKDYMRLKTFSVLKDKLYYLPITIKLDRPDIFNAIIKKFVNA